MKRILTTVALMLAARSTFTESPCPTVKALSEQQLVDLNEGRGMGMALSAELMVIPVRRTFPN